MDFVSHGEEFGFYPKWTGKLVEGFGQRNEHFQRITQGILWRVNLQQGRKQGKWLRSHYNSRETVVTRASWWQWRWREVTRFWLQFRNRADSIDDVFSHGVREKARSQRWLKCLDLKKLRTCVSFADLEKSKGKVGLVVGWWRHEPKILSEYLKFKKPIYGKVFQSYSVSLWTTPEFPFDCVGQLLCVKSVSYLRHLESFCSAKELVRLCVDCPEGPWASTPTTWHTPRDQGILLHPRFHVLPWDNADACVYGPSVPKKIEFHLPTTVTSLLMHFIDFSPFLSHFPIP